MLGCLLDKCLGPPCKPYAFHWRVVCKTKAVWHALQRLLVQVWTL